MKLEDSYLRELLARLDGKGENASAPSDGAALEPDQDELSATESTAAASSDAGASGLVIAAQMRRKADPNRAAAELEQRLALLRERISSLSESGETSRPAAMPTPITDEAATVASPPQPSVHVPISLPPNGEFLPLAPLDLAGLGVSQEEVELLVLKFLMNRAASSGRQIADQLGVPFSLMEKILSSLKAGQSIVLKGAAPLGDHIYQLTAAGVEEARQAMKQCSYFGTVPVPLEVYIDSVERQSIGRTRPGINAVERIFHDLLVAETVRQQVGQAIHSGKGFFLYGAPGNGKTSIAERVARAFGQTIWIPRALGIAGEIVRLYDPCNHEEVPVQPGEQLGAAVDRRWVRIQRPTVITGGELTMDRLEIAVNRTTGINEAPLQLKSNCGVLVIDDFGRQRMSVAELLNRWIVPLDRRYDFLQLPSGKTVQVPFDQLLVFSTNLEPRDLVDEAFLRRIAYKIEIGDPSLDDFRTLLTRQAERLGCPMDLDAVEHLIAEHYVRPQRAVRACHARDLLDQVQSYCGFRELPLTMSPAAFDAAARNYFGLMQGTGR